MALFEKDDQEAGSEPSGPGTVVGANVKLTGVLKDSNDITVHGRVEGEVISDHAVTVTETAEIKGPITAQNITVAGKVNGSITAADKLEVLPTGRVYGSITVSDLIIRSGALFIGKSTMPDQKDEGGSSERRAETEEPAETADEAEAENEEDAEDEDEEEAEEEK